jgi:hypothetical protein
MKVHKNDWLGKNGETLKLDQGLFVLTGPQKLKVLDACDAQWWLEENGFPNSGEGIPATKTARACTLLALCPTWSTAKIAEWVGCSPSNLSKCAEFQNLRQAIRLDGAARKPRKRKSRWVRRKAS